MSMQDFLITVAAYSQSYQGPIQYNRLREQLANIGLRDYLINDANEWIELPPNIFAAWVEGENGDAVLGEWRQRLGAIFGSGKSPGAFFVAVGTDAVWLSQTFE
jgi:hypothetical protein